MRFIILAFCINTLFQNYSWKWFPSAPPWAVLNSKFKMGKVKPEHLSPPIKIHSASQVYLLESLLIMPELSQIAPDKWDMSTAPTIIHNEIKSSDQCHCSASLTIMKTKAHCYIDDLIISSLLANHVLLSQCITARIMHISCSWMLWTGGT